MGLLSLFTRRTASAVWAPDGTRPSGTSMDAAEGQIGQSFPVRLRHGAIRHATIILTFCAVTLDGRISGDYYAVVTATLATRTWSAAAAWMMPRPMTYRQAYAEAVNAAVDVAYGHRAPASVLAQFAEPEDAPFAATAVLGWDGQPYETGD